MTYIITYWTNGDILRTVPVEASSLAEAIEKLVDDRQWPLGQFVSATQIGDISEITIQERKP